MGVGVIGESKLVFYKELAAGMYTPAAYVIAQLLAELPWLLGLAFLHTVIFYPIMQLYDDPTYYFQYFLVCFLFLTVFSFYGQMMGAVLPTARGAGLFVGGFMGIMDLFTGFWLPERAIPWPWRLFYYILPARYALKAAMPPQFYCSMSCFASLQDPARPVVCNGAGSENVTSLVQAPYYAKGPGCSIMEDWSGQVRIRLCGFMCVCVCVCVRVCVRVFCFFLFLRLCVSSNIED
jgi:hypothetical protein